MARLHADLLRCALANLATGPGIDDGGNHGPVLVRSRGPRQSSAGSVLALARMRRSVHFMLANASLERQAQDRLDVATCDSKWAEHMPALTLPVPSTIIAFALAPYASAPMYSV